MANTNPSKDGAAPAILLREGVCFGKAWRQYFVITNARCAVVEMTQALMGWNLGSVTVHDGDAFPRYTRDQIVEWYLSQNHASCGVPTVRAEVAPSFLPKLIAHAGVEIV